MKIKVKSVSAVFKKQNVLDNCFFVVQSGESVGLVAPNGTGKTTLLKAMVGLEKTKKGKIQIDETIDLYQNRERFLHEVFFILSNEILYENLTVLDHLEMLKELWHSSASIDEASQFFKIHSFHKKKVKQLSLGMKQQLILTMYLVSEAPILLFD